MPKFPAGQLTLLFDRDSPNSKTATAWAVALFVLVSSILLAWVLIKIPIPEVQETSSWAYSAFRHGIYYPVKAFIEGHNPYDSQAYMSHYPVHDPFRPFLPMTLLIHFPLGYLPIKPAAAVFFCANLGLCLLMVWLSFRIASVKITTAGVFLVGTLLLLSRPGLSNILLGEGTALVGAGAYVALYGKDKYPLLASLGFGLTCFKPQFGLPLGLLLLFSNHYRVAILGGLAALLLSAGPVALLWQRVGENQSFISLLAEGYHASEHYLDSSPIRSSNRIDIKALASRIVGENLPPLSETLIAVSVLVLAGCLCFRLRLFPNARKTSAELMILAMLSCVYHQRYDFLLLIAPLVNLCANGDSPPWDQFPKLRWLAIGLMLLPGVNYISSTTGLQHLGFSVGSSFWIVLSSLNGLALVFLLAIYSTVAFRADLRPEPAGVKGA